MSFPASPAIQADQSDKRTALFCETARERLERIALGSAWALMPERVTGLPGLARVWARNLVSPILVSPMSGLPDPNQALTRPDGLCGIVHDLSPATLMEAYRRSLFPWAHVGPLKWWSPAQRCVLFFDELHIAKRLRRQMRQGKYRVTFDRDFEAVIAACSGRRDGRWHLTWITPRIMRAYAGLYDAGHVHSFEVWNEAGHLAGGGYGVSAAGAFFTESQFSLEPNTSKIGFAMLNWHLAHWGFSLNDGKFPTPTILDMQFRNIPRTEFRRRLDEGRSMEAPPGRWNVETDLETVAAWQPGGPKHEKAA